MNFKNIKIIFFLLILNNCTTTTIQNEGSSLINKKNFINSGFTLVYGEELYNKKIISKKLDNRGLLIFQKNLKEGTPVRIKNMLNNKSTVGKVGKHADYPSFNNSVISIKIAEEINLDFNQPYIEIFEILHHKSFIVKKAKTFDEEKNVADKAPVDSISINNIGVNNEKITEKKENLFKFTIKIADFYFKDTANTMVKRIKDETPIQNVSIRKLSNTQYRVFLGPFLNIKLLKKAFNDITILQFENIEIINDNKVY